MFSNDKKSTSSVGLLHNLRATEGLASFTWYNSRYLKKFPILVSSDPELDIFWIDYFYNIIY